MKILGSSILRSSIKFLFSFIISLLIGWWAYRQSGSPEYQVQFKLMDWYLVPLFSCLIILGGLTRSWRLAHLFFPSYGQFRKIFKVLFFSFSFSFLLGGVGFLIRLLFLRRGIGSHHVVSLGFISMEKLFDLVLAFIVLFFLFNIPNTEYSLISWIHDNRIIVITPIVFFLVWFYYHYDKVFRFFLAVFKKLSQSLSLPLRYYFFCKRQVFYICKSLESVPPKKIVSFIWRSTLIFVVESSFFYFSIKFLGIRIELSQALLLNAVIILALLIPALPSGIGLFQAAIVFVLGGGDVFYASLLIHFFLIITHLIMITLGLYQFSNYLKYPLIKGKFGRGTPIIERGGDEN